MNPITMESGEGPAVKNLEAMIEFAQEGIVSKTFLERPGVKIVLFCMTKGQSLSEHTSSMPATIHVLKGTGTVTLGSEKHASAPGTWIYMPREQKHAVDAEEDLVFLLTLFRKG
ncbi:MAG: cupin domain-containing protein [Methanomassiliicoccus sp.]|nr:cupin domain-containing protein [Methanomassiliicoccus sp.]